MTNERLTENIFETLLKEKGYYNNDKIKVEFQKSDIYEINKLLKTASKSNISKRQGYPDFIISSTEYPDLLIVVECKANTHKHKSNRLELYKDYAVEGVLHYAKFLKKSYHVIAIAFSGQSIQDSIIDIFLYHKESDSYKVLQNRYKTDIKELLNFKDFADNASYDEDVYNKRHKDLMEFASYLHNFMRDYAKLTESEKPLLVSGTLLALNNKAFFNSYNAYSPSELQQEWLNVIKKEINKADIPQAKKANMIQPYSSIAVHPELGKPTTKYPRGLLYELIKMLNDNVFPYIKYFTDYDVVGQFYGEFLKYTGGDKKGLGIVLTPKHITELFCLIANIRKDSKVLDPCVGTAGFLISAMDQMLKLTNTEKEKEQIKKHNLIGVEQQPNMFALAASNMILRGDGKANLYQNSCFDEDIKKEIKEKKCNIGMMNPPYSQKGEKLHELDFVFNMVDMLTKGAIGIAIIPMSCVSKKNKLKEKLLKYHTLEAVMSMPDNLFYPVATVTCIVVFKAHIPHEDMKKETWFGYWKNDGFKLLRHQGRVNINWENIKKQWKYNYDNKKEVAGHSVMKYVTAKDEWCAESYMETDYSTLNVNDFINTLHLYISFLFCNKLLKEPRIQAVNSINTKLLDKNWKWFKYKDIFQLNRGKEKIQDALGGHIPLVSSTSSNNGITTYIKEGKHLFSNNRLTVANNGSIGYTFYQAKDFYATSDITVLNNEYLNKYNSMFIITLISLEKYRFNYGLKWSKERMKDSLIKLPVTQQGNPDWQFMEDYIKSLPYSSNL